MIDDDPLTPTRPSRVAVMLSDGVFYDNPWPQQAAAGLGHFCVPTYALALPGGEKGRNVSPTKQQLADLASITRDKTRVYNFGLDGYNLLAPFGARSFASLAPSKNIKRLTLG